VRLLWRLKDDGGHAGGLFTYFRHPVIFGVVYTMKYSVPLQKGLQCNIHTTYRLMSPTVFNFNWEKKVDSLTSFTIPGCRFPNSISSMEVRINRMQRWRIAATILRTCLNLPSVMVMLSHVLSI
jgi:hypothetical protein